MKILLISHLYPSSNRPYNGIFFSNKVRSLQNTGNSVTVICPIPLTFGFMAKLKKKWATYHSTPTYEKREGVDVYYPRYVRFPGRWFRPFEGFTEFWSLKRLASKLHRQSSFDTVLGGMLTNDGVAAVLLARQFNRPAVNYVIGDDVNSYPYESKLMYRLCSWLIENSQLILSNGEHFAKKFFQVFPWVQASHVVVNRIGLQLSTYAGDKSSFLRAKFKITEEKVVALFVGEISITKGVPELIETVIQLQHPNLVLVIVGMGPYFEEAKRLIEKSSFTDRILLLGKIGDELPLYYRSVDFFIFPSHTEGMPGVISEACAAALPIVASDIPGNRDMVKEGINGFFFPVKDKLLMEQKIQQMTESPELRLKMGLASRQLAEQYLDEDKIASELTTTLAQLRVPLNLKLKENHL